MFIESGIIADILASPETETSQQNIPVWPLPSSYPKTKPPEIKTTRKYSIPNKSTQKEKVPSEQEHPNSQSECTSSNPYINTDSIAVHL